MCAFMSAIGISSEPISRHATLALWQPEEISYEAVEKRRFAADNPIYRIACGADGKLLAVAHSGPDAKIGSIDLWELETGKKKWSIPAKGSGYSDLAFSPDGKTLLAVGGKSPNLEHRLEAFSVETGKELFSFRVNGGRSNVPFHPDGFFAVNSGGRRGLISDANIQFRNANDGSVLREIKGQSGMKFGRQMAFSSDGKSLATQGFTDKFEIFDTATGESQRTLELKDYAFAVCFSPGGKILATGGRDVQIWDTASWKLERRLAVSCATMAFSPDGKRLAMASLELKKGDKGVVSVRDVRTGEELCTFARGGRVGVAFPKNNIVVALAEERVVAVYELSVKKK